jgi:CPA2 family monovalent cation:H+ antiporter-2
LDNKSLHEIDLLLTLAAGFVAALALGFVAIRLGLSPIVGYLLAGVLVGPFTPGFVADRHMAEQLSEFGIILLMFGVGLQFHIEELMAVRRIAIAGAIVQSTAATLLGGVILHSFGFSWSQGIMFGLALSVASTVVLVRVLSDHNQMQSAAGRIAIGWLVVEDIFTVFVLVLLPVIFDKTGSGNQSLPVALLLAALKIAVFAAFTLYAGGRLIPWLLTRVAQTHSRELFTLSVLGTAMGIAVSAAVLFDVSMALGAFLAGMVVGRSDFSARAASEAIPMRDAFAVMFFISVGMLFDPGQALAQPLLIAATTLVVMVVKPIAALLVIAVLGSSSKVGLAVAVALAQIGEFSFLLATLALQVGALPQQALNPIVAAAILSIMLNSLLYRGVAPVEKWLTAHPRFWRLLNRNADREHQQSASAAPPGDPAHRAIIVGYGMIGRTIADILRRYGIEPTIIEMNLETCREIRAQGRTAIYGDANSVEVLEQAGVRTAASLILSASGSSRATEAVRAALELNPQMHIVARADFLAEAPALARAGAIEVFSGEGELALAITASILDRLGATPDQLDQNRRDIRESLSAATAPHA